jgi:Nucleotidyl transferase AbiEii toxin, Type IV TA system
LAATEPYGFALAGGYAVQAHGFVERVSEDVDLFTVAQSSDDFDRAVESAVKAYRAAGLTVEVSVHNAGFARLNLSDADGTAVKVELGVDWRAHPPVRLAIGAVLHPDDAIGNKLAALYGRAEVRDYVDIGGVLRSGRYTTDDLLRLGMAADPGLVPGVLARALRAIDRVSDGAFAQHGLAEPDIAGLRRLIHAWADQLAD